jgi:hypothetical protein
MERDNYLCVYCGSPATCIDHVLPWWYYQNDEEWNLVASCQECNAIAGGKIFDTIDKKAEYIRQTIKNNPRWQHHKSQYYAIIYTCMCCKRAYPLTSWSTVFLCPDCFRIEYKEYFC